MKIDIKIRKIKSLIGRLAALSKNNTGSSSETDWSRKSTRGNDRKDIRLGDRVIIIIK